MVGEPSENDPGPALLRPLRLLCLVVLLVPAAVLVVCAVLSGINENAGWLRHPLPGLFLLIYLLAGLASPLVGVGALAVVFFRRRGPRAGGEESRLRTHVVVLSLLDISSAVVWALLLPYVLFSAGGSR